MKRIAKTTVIALVLAGLAEPALSQNSVREMMGQAKALFDAGGGGRFKAEMVTDPSLPAHVIYRPRNLAAAGKIPIVSWGNGGCFNRGDIYKYLLTEIASNGYLVIASGAMGTNDIDALYASMGDAPPPPAAGAGTGEVGAPRAVGAPMGAGDAAKMALLKKLLTNTPMATTSAQMKEAIDWAIAENSRKGSPYYGRIDTKHVAVMGVSCGGWMAIENSRDPRVSTSIIWNSGTFPDGGPSGGAGKTVNATRADMAKYHGPVAYISGDTSDVAFENANADFDLINGVPAFRAYKKGIGHDGTYIQPAGGAYGKVGIAWLNWQLKHDLAAARMFKGKDCTLCTDPDWTVRKKMID